MLTFINTIYGRQHEASMIRTVLKYGAPHLEKPSQPVVEFDASLRELAADMLETMYAAPGIGLAAPQIGINTRLVVIDLSAEKKKDTSSFW